MGKPAIDITGQRFGRLVVLRRSKSRAGNATWVVRCDCGVSKTVSGSNLRGNTRSCGCLALETRTTHGLAEHPLYFTWANLIRRCGNADYGEIYRSVKVHPPWRDVTKFINYVDKYLGPRPSPEHTIDRKDNLGDYVPGNIRWASKQEQSNNRRSVRLFDYRGERGTARDFAIKYGINFCTLRTRLFKGWTICQALETPLSEPHVISNRKKKARSGKAQKRMA